jgi:hypothetical protein
MVAYEKHEQENNGTNDNSVLKPAQGRIEERPASASHFTGHQKVNIDEYNDDIDAARHSTRNQEA